LEIAKRTLTGKLEATSEAIKGALDEGVSKEEVREREPSLFTNYISDEDWNLLSDDLDNLLRKLNQNEEFRCGVQRLFKLGDAIVEDIQSSQVVMHRSGSGVSRSGERAAEEVQKEAKGLLSQFTGEDTLDRFLASVRKLITAVEVDERAKDWYSKFRETVLHVATSYSDTSELNEFRKLANEAREIFSKHEDAVRAVLEGAREMLDNISNDKLLQRLKDSVATLSDDLYWEDKSGNRYFDVNVAGILGASISDVIKEQFKYLALPRIERHQDDYAFTLDNTVICANLPERIDFHIESDISINFAHLGDHSNNSVLLTAALKGIRARAEDMSFTYHKFTTPQFSEHGIMDMELVGDGADLTLEFEMKPSANGKYVYSRTKSHFDIMDLEIHFRKETLKHYIMVPLFTKVFKSSIIRRFQSSIEESLDEKLIVLGKQVTSILNDSPNPLAISSYWP